MPLPKILVIEDNPADVFILIRMLKLQEAEFEVELVGDGERALQYVHSRRKNSHDLTPCVILLDLHLPKHDGLEVLRAIRQDPDLGHIQVVATTSVISPAQEAELRRLGAHYRLKPTNLSQVRELACDLIAICKGWQIAA